MMPRRGPDLACRMDVVHHWYRPIDYCLPIPPWLLHLFMTSPSIHGTSVYPRLIYDLSIRPLPIHSSMSSLSIYDLTIHPLPHPSNCLPGISIFSIAASRLFDWRFRCCHRPFCTGFQILSLRRSWFQWDFPTSQSFWPAGRWRHQGRSGRRKRWRRLWKTQSDRTRHLQRIGQTHVTHTMPWRFACYHSLGQSTGEKELEMERMIAWLENWGKRNRSKRGRMNRGQTEN